MFIPWRLVRLSEEATTGGFFTIANSRGRPGLFPWKRKVFKRNFIMRTHKLLSLSSYFLSFIKPTRRLKFCELTAAGVTEMLHFLSLPYFTHKLVEITNIQASHLSKSAWKHSLRFLPMVFFVLTSCNDLKFSWICQLPLGNVISEDINPWKYDTAIKFPLYRTHKCLNDPNLANVADNLTFLFSPIWESKGRNRREIQHDPYPLVSLLECMWSKSTWTGGRGGPAIMFCEQDKMQ